MPEIALLTANREPSQPIIVLLVLSLAAASLVFGATLLGRRGRSLLPSVCPSVRSPACPPAPFSPLCFAVLASQRRVHINHSSYRIPAPPVTLHPPSLIHTGKVFLKAGDLSVSVWWGKREENHKQNQYLLDLSA